MKTTTMVYAGLFSALMIGSYLTWTKAPETSGANEEASIVLIDAKPAELQSVKFTSKEIDVTFEQKTDKLGTYLWVTTTRRVDNKVPANPHDPSATTPIQDGKTKIEKSAFKAGKAGDQLLADLAPFRVRRELEVKDDQLANFGFDKPEGSLEVTTTAGTRKFEIGATAYGHKSVYLRDEKSKQIYVIKRSIVTPMERADSRLPEKDLFAGATNDIVSASVSTPNGALDVVQRNRDDAAKATWTAPNSDAANASASAWLDKVFRLRSSNYLSPGAQPEAELVFAVKLGFEDGNPVTVEVMRGLDDKGEEAWYGRSEYTRGLVQLSSGLAADTAADVATLFAGEGE